MLRWTLEFPSDFADFEWELEAKGWFSGAKLVVDDSVFSVTFYDPVRLGQDIAEELGESVCFFEANLVVVQSVTMNAMMDAAGVLVTSGSYRSLAPLADESGR